MSGTVVITLYLLFYLILVVTLLGGYLDLPHFINEETGS